MSITWARFGLRPRASPPRLRTRKRTPIEAGVDVTPPFKGACPHCHEQLAYAIACRRAARAGEPVPDRRNFVEQRRPKTQRE
jgi:hypothetical protein